jgi:apolipoprotein N-acyltransferase
MKFMLQPPAENQTPLVVDLDGTLIDTDLLWESLAQYLRRNPLGIFLVLFWWTRGRAFLKRKLSKRVKFDPAALPFNADFLRWLKEQKASGRKIILATASDFDMAKPVADYFQIFDDVLASDGRTNLRSENKLKALTEKFGERKFDYAGNSSADLAVWRGVRKAIVVNASPSVQKQAAAIAEVAMSFNETYSPVATLKRFLNGLFIHSGYLVAIAGGLLLAAAFPNVGFAGGAWVAPALLAFAAQNKSGADAFRVGMVAGLVSWLVSLYWLLEIPCQWHSLPLLPGLGWLVLSTVLSLFMGAWVWLISNHPRLTSFWTGRFVWAIVGAAVWVALEMVRARLLGGFPWNFLGTSQYKMVPLIQIASITGVYGVSFLIVWTSLSGYSTVRMVFAKPNSRFAWQPEIFPPLLAVAILFALGEFKVSEPAKTTSTLHVTMIQPSIPQNLIWDETANSNRFDQLLQLSDTALTNQTDLLVWPESAVPDIDVEYNEIVRFVAEHHVWLVFNADDAVPRPNATNEYDNDVYTAAFLCGPEGRLRFNEIYHKQNLVMFGEYIPFTWLPFVKWFTPITGSYLPGHSAMRFDLENLGVTASPLICYEDMFPQTGREAAQTGADFLVNVTNDGWFGDSAEQWQHETGAIFRAVENGLPLIRCCNNGITCWVDGYGRQQEIFRDEKDSVYGMGAMAFDLPLGPHPPTFYTHHGDLFGWGCVAIATCLCAIKAAQRLKYKEENEPAKA